MKTRWKRDLLVLLDDGDSFEELLAAVEAGKRALRTKKWRKLHVTADDYELAIRGERMETAAEAKERADLERRSAEEHARMRLCEIKRLRERIVELENGK